MDINLYYIFAAFYSLLFVLLWNVFDVDCTVYYCNLYQFTLKEECQHLFFIIIFAFYFYMFT